MKHGIIRETLVKEAEDSFLVVATQVDRLFDLVSFYLERHPPSESSTNLYLLGDLQETVGYLAEHISHLSEVIKQWKKGHDRVLSRTGTEVSIINEVVANINALIFFLEKSGIDLEPFDKPATELAMSTIIRCNRLVT